MVELRDCRVLRDMFRCRLSSKKDWRVTGGRDRAGRGSVCDSSRKELGVVAGRW